jgi:hypothetical protein
MMVWPRLAGGTLIKAGANPTASQIKRKMLSDPHALSCLENIQRKQNRIPIKNINAPTLLKTGR